MAEAMTDAITLIVMSLPRPLISAHHYEIRRQIASVLLRTDTGTAKNLIVIAPAGGGQAGERPIHHRSGGVNDPALQKRN
jgi:hypothetical protein